MRKPMFCTRSLVCLLPLVVVTACAVGTAAPDTTVDATGASNLPSLPAPTTAGGPASPGDASAPDAEVHPADAGGDAPAAQKPDAAPATGCPGYAAPTQAAPCKCTAAKNKSCAANNCYGGYYCELTSTPAKCVPRPSSCP